MFCKSLFSLCRYLSSCTSFSCISDFLDLFNRNYIGNNYYNGYLNLTPTLLPCRHIHLFKNSNEISGLIFPLDLNSFWFLHRTIKIILPAFEILRGNGSKFVYLWPPVPLRPCVGECVHNIIIFFILSIIVRHSFPYLLIFIYCALSYRNF